MKHTKFKMNKVDSLYQTKTKTTRLRKRVSCGVVLMASTMLHEKCCNMVLQIGAPVRSPDLNRIFNILKTSSDRHDPRSVNRHLNIAAYTTHVAYVFSF